MTDRRKHIEEFNSAEGTSLGIGDISGKNGSDGTSAGQSAAADHTTPEEAIADQAIAEMMRKAISSIGDDPSREGLRDTPERFSRALRFLTSGYAQDAGKILNGAVFTTCYDEMVMVKNIEMYSLCEHHVLPFFGKCHVAYLPDKKVVGLSKIPRLVNMFSRRLQIQERLTSQIAQAIQDCIHPLGVGVVIEARHMCMEMRGVEKQNSETITSAMLGEFRESQQTREEFLSLIRRDSR